MNWIALIANRTTLMLAVAAALLSGAYWHGHSSGFDAGSASGNDKAAAAEKRAAALDVALADAEIKNLGWQTQLTEVRNVLAAERTAEQAQQAQADKAVAAARAAAATAAANARTWTANFQRALATPACAAQARIVLCDAFQSY